MKHQYYTKIQFYESSDVAKNSVVDISSVKLVDESSASVEYTGLKLEELDEKYVSVPCTSDNFYSLKIYF